MKNLMIIGVLAIAVGSIAVFNGCGPRVGVAKDAIIAKLDKALGELNVKRKSIELKQKELRGQLAELKENRYRTEAKLELFEAKKQKSEKALASILGKAKQVQELVKEVKESSEGTIERNGKTYTAAQIDETAQEVMSMHSMEKTKLDSFNVSYNALAESVKFLAEQETTASKLMRDLETKISEIDAKKIAVDAVKESTSIAGDNKSISKNLEEMTKEIEDLGVELEVALKMETGRMKSLSDASSAATDILSETTNLDSTESQLDALLGGE